MTSLSGGEKNVLSLAQALLSEPDLLLLDEPANHLDYLGVAWLEDFLVKFGGTVLIVSHNRYLLDRVVGGILELEGGRIQEYSGGYSDYRGEKLRRLISQQRDYVVNQKRLAQLEALVKRFEQIARSKADPAWGRRLRARRSQLEREKRQAVEKPVLSRGAVSASFTTEATRSDIAVQVRGYSRAFGDRQLFDDADLHIASGERVALVGPNGAGKTTLLRDIVEKGDWNSRTIRIGPSIRLGYAAQEQEVLRPERTILEEVGAGAAISSNEAFGLLRRFLFGWEDLDKKVADLSGGERNRLQLARLMAVRPSLLVLDEPTNHLDIPTREAVEEALEDYAGTVLVVSHDRYFLDKVAGRVVELQDGKLVSFDGNFSEFWYARQALESPVQGTRQDEGAKQGAGEGRAGAAEGQGRVAGAPHPGDGGREAGPGAAGVRRLRPGRAPPRPPAGQADRAHRVPARRPLRPVDERESVASQYSRHEGPTRRCVGADPRVRPQGDRCHYVGAGFKPALFQRPCTDTCRNEDGRPP